MDTVESCVRPGHLVKCSAAPRDADALATLQFEFCGALSVHPFCAKRFGMTKDDGKAQEACGSTSEGTSDSSDSNSSDDAISSQKAQAAKAKRTTMAVSKEATTTTADNDNGAPARKR